MNGFIKKSIGTLTLGEKLKKLRTDKRISLNEVSRATRIQVKYLECLEEDNFDKLPVDVYTRGFLRSYADFLGVDGQILLKLYDKEKGIRKNISNSGKSSGKKKVVDISSFVFTPRKILILAIIVIVFFGIFLLYKEIGSLSSAPRLIILNPEPNSEVSENSVYVEGITDKDASLFINGQPIMVNDEGKFRENLTLQPGVNVINIKSINKFQKETINTLTLRSSWTYEGDSGQSNSDKVDNEKVAENIAPAEDKISLELRVNPGPVWISVEADGSLVFSGTMLSGAIQLFSAKDKITVNSGKGEATFVVFNGKDLGVLSAEAGAVRGVVFTKDTKY